MDPSTIFENFKNIITQHYADFSGRTRRSVFWYYVLAYFVILVGLSIVQGIIGTRLLTGLYTLGLFLPTLAIGVRRLHDTNRTGWLVLIGAVPAVLFLVLSSMALVAGAGGFMFISATVLPLLSLIAAGILIYWYAQPGTVGDNAYGPDPKTGTSV